MLAALCLILILLPSLAQAELTIDSSLSAGYTGTAGIKNYDLYSVAGKLKIGINDKLTNATSIKVIERRQDEAELYSRKRLINRLEYQYSDINYLYNEFYYTQKSIEQYHYRANSFIGAGHKLYNTDNLDAEIYSGAGIERIEYAVHNTNYAGLQLGASVKYQLSSVTMLEPQIIKIITEDNTHDSFSLTMHIALSNLLDMKLNWSNYTN